MSDIPLSHSDLQCPSCFLYFRFEGDLYEHSKTHDPREGS